jgi:hypothetical protein
LGSSKILSQVGGKKALEQPSRRRIGLVVSGAPAREGAKIYDVAGGHEIGVVTSGGTFYNLFLFYAMLYVGLISFWGWAFRTFTDFEKEYCDGVCQEWVSYFWERVECSSAVRAYLFLALFFFNSCTLVEIEVSLRRRRWSKCLL